MTNNRGKLIVIDGTDGSGKATQTRLLVYRLKQLGYKVETIDFPQYDTKSSGLIENYLEGKYGEADEVNPMVSSCFYACDRYDASFQIKNWLREGKIVIIDRYVTSNMAHQGCKIKNLLARRDFYSWLHRLEYNLFRIPEPDLTLVLHVEAEIAQGLLKARPTKGWKDKKNDIHEDQIDHLKKAEQIYIEIAHSFSDIKLLKCTIDNKMLSPERISTLVWNKVKEEIEDMPHLYHSTPQNDNQTPLLKIKKLSEKAHYTEIENEAHYGINLYSTEYHSLNPKEKITVDTDIEINIPEGISAMILKNQNNNIHVLTEKLTPNTKKKIKIELINLGDDIHHISPGDILAEMIIQKKEIIEFIEEENEDNQNFRVFKF